jgi:hypothetical protein
MPKKRKVRVPRQRRAGAKNDKQKSKVKQSVKVNVNVEGSRGGAGGSTIPMPMPMQFANRSGEDSAIQKLTDSVRQLVKSSNNIEVKAQNPQVNEDNKEVPKTFRDVSDTRGLPQRAEEKNNSKITDLFQPENNNQDSLMASLQRNLNNEEEMLGQNDENQGAFGTYYPYEDVPGRKQLQDKIKKYDSRISKEIRKALKADGDIDTEDINKMDVFQLQMVLDALNRL